MPDGSVQLEGLIIRGTAQRWKGHGLQTFRDCLYMLYKCISERAVTVTGADIQNAGNTDGPVGNKGAHSQNGKDKGKDFWL